MVQLLLIAARSLFQHRLRTSLLGAAIAAATALLIVMTSISTGVSQTLLESSTTLMTGHLNVSGFFKITSGQSAPVVTDFEKITLVVQKALPEVDYITHRGRGWAKLISDTGSAQAVIGGLDIANEPGFRRVVVVREGRIDDLAKPNSVLLFAKQAEKLGVRVGDSLTLSAPTPRGTNNTADVTVVAIANDIGLMSGMSIFMQEQSLRRLYRLNDNTTGAVQIYLKGVDLRDESRLRDLEARLRVALTSAGFVVMEPDEQPFFAKFERVNREDWTGQRLDVTNWKGEISFIAWVDSALTWLSIIVIAVLMSIICVGIMNVTWISIRERTREIGTLRAIGMQKGSVLIMFVSEGFLLGVVGTALGAGLGLLTSAGLNSAHLKLPLAFQIFLMTDHLVLVPTLGWLVGAWVVLTGCISLVSLVPSFIAARMKPITAMHHIG